MTRHINTKKPQYTAGSKKRTYYNKQEKYLNRQLWWLEGRQDANGNTAHYTKGIYALRGDGDSNPGDNGVVQGFDYICPSAGVTVCNTLFGIDETPGAAFPLFIPP